MTKPDKVLIIVRNVTDRKRAESALEASRRLAQRIAETMPNVVFVYDLAERRNVYVNDRSAEVLGYTAREIIDMGDQFLPRTMHPDDLNRLPALAAEYAQAKDGEVLEHEFRFRHKDRGWRWIHRCATVFARTADGRAQELLGTATDVTTLKTIEQALRVSHERYALATAAGSVGVWEWNLATQEMFGDRSLSAALGYENDALSTRLEEWRARIHPNDLEHVLSRIRAHLKGETAVFESEHRMVHKDGAVRWCLTRGAVTEWENDRAVRLTGTCTDITSRKEAQDELDHAKAELVRLQRITTLGEVSAALSHEMNQPLTAIMSNARTCLRLLAAPHPDLDELRDALRDVVQEAKRASDVIRHTRQVFTRDQPEKMPLDVNDLIRESTVLAQDRALEVHVLLQTFLATNLPAVRGDRVAIQQTLWNLVTNAIDAMRAVPLTARARVLTIRSSLDNGAVQVAIEDTGSGIREADVNRVFDAFFTTKSDGMGMGLSISRTIVEGHGGRLWVARSCAQGTVFCFSLPPLAAHDEVVGAAVLPPRTARQASLT